MRGTTTAAATRSSTTTTMITIRAGIEPTSARPSPCSRGQQPVEEGPVALQRLAQLLGVGVVAALPGRFQPSLVLAEPSGQGLHQFGYQAIGGLHCLLRIVDEACLHVVPLLPEARPVRRVEQSHVTALARGPCTGPRRGRSGGLVRIGGLPHAGVLAGVPAGRLGHALALAGRLVHALALARRLLHALALAGRLVHAWALAGRPSHARALAWVHVLALVPALAGHRASVPARAALGLQGLRTRPGSSLVERGSLGSGVPVRVAALGLGPLLAPYSSGLGEIVRAQISVAAHVAPPVVCPCWQTWPEHSRDVSATSAEPASGPAHGR